MPDTDPNLNYDDAGPYQLTQDDLSELHGMAQQLQAAGDPRADRVWNFIDAQTNGDTGDPAAKGTIYRQPQKVTSWVDDLEGSLWGDAAENSNDSSGDVSIGKDNAEKSEDQIDSAQPDQFKSVAEEDGPTTQADVGDGDESDVSQQALPVNQKSKPKYKTENTGVSAEDKANGNYVIVGFRHLLRDNPLEKIFYHTYVKIPVIGPDGKPEKDEEDKDKDKVERWGVLGNPTSSENQQVRDDSRNDQDKGFEGKEVLVKVTPTQREALRQRMQYFNQQDPQTHKFVHPCPVCGSRYGLTDRNSNTFVYNMLYWDPGGDPGTIKVAKPPSELRTPAYYKNEPDENWYEKK